MVSPRVLFGSSDVCAHLCDSNQSARVTPSVYALDVDKVQREILQLWSGSVWMSILLDAIEISNSHANSIGLESETLVATAFYERYSDKNY